MIRRPGGDRIYEIFDYQLPSALKKLPLDRHLSLQNVKKVVCEADGYQPHLIAPEQGYRRLIEGALNFFRGPADASVDAVSVFFSTELIVTRMHSHICICLPKSQRWCFFRTPSHRRTLSELACSTL